MKLQENTTFANRYQLERLLGRGGFSEVWLAKDNWTHLRIALKVYAPGQGMDANGLQEFCGELANVFDLNHTNLLKPTHVDTWNDMPYLIMAYCSQGSLASKIGQLSEDQIWKLIHDVAAGLAYLHNKDVVHQDIKPDNILIDESGNYVITDFGISTRARSTLRKSVVGGTASGGTTAYMGPERFSRQPAPTKASDVWSFGAMVYEVVEGNVPFGEIGGGLQKGGAEIPYITANISDALKFTIYKMLSKDTWDRPTAETLVTWSQAPQSIDIDYDLLTSEETPEVPPLAPELISEPKPTIIDTSRQTQRFSDPEPQQQPRIELSVSPETLQAQAETANYLINVKSEKKWSTKRLQSAEGWIRIDERDNTSFTIWCYDNKTGETRTGYVYVNNGDDEKSICITQPSLPKKSKARVWWLITVLALIVIIPTCVNLQNKNSKPAKTEKVVPAKPAVTHENDELPAVETIDENWYKKECEQFLNKNKKRQGVRTTISGLQFERIKLGEGKYPKANDRVKIHYVGTLIDGSIFDSSVERGEPVTFDLGQIIDGLKEGIQLMPLGSKFKFFIPQELAYGEREVGTIPSYSCLIFEVELLEIEGPDNKEAQVEKEQSSLSQILCGTHKLRLQWLEPAMGRITISEEKSSKGYYGSGLINGDNGYLKIEGYFTIQDANNITFSGRIEQRISYIADGKVAYRDGVYHFKSYNGRKYWRMQEMSNPIDECTDYIDIFFK